MMGSVRIIITTTYIELNDCDDEGLNSGGRKG